MEVTDSAVAISDKDADKMFSQTLQQFQAPDLTPVSSTRTKLHMFLGTHEFYSAEMWRSALVELLATGTLMFTLTSSIVSCLDSKETDPKLLVPIAVFINAFLLLMATVPLSGGHMSPVFTFIAVLKGDITFARSLIYLLAQCIGSIIGFTILRSVMNHETAQKYSLGGCCIRGAEATNSGLSPGTALLLEFMCTFLVLFVGATIAFDGKQFKELGLVNFSVVVAGALAIAMFVSITITGNPDYAGVGLNPARCLGAALVQGGPLWYGHWVFWVGPFLACLVYYGFSANFPKKGIIPLDEEHGIFKMASLCGRANCNNPRIAS